MKTIKVTVCKEDRFREFPHLRFYKTEGNEFFFDASDYLEKNKCTDTHTVEQFQSVFSFWTDAACACYKLKIDDLVVVNEEDGHILIDQCLALLFIAYIDPWFAIHMLERITEMLTTGIVLSDTMLLYMARERFTQKDILTTFEENAHEKNNV